MRERTGNKKQRKREGEQERRRREGGKEGRRGKDSEIKEKVRHTMTNHTVYARVLLLLKFLL